MKNRILTVFGILITVSALAIAGVFYFDTGGADSSNQERSKVKDNPVKTKKARSEFFFRMLKDPSTNRIPQNIRSRELEFSRGLPSRNGGGLQFKQGAVDRSSLNIDWQLAGPEGLGGRTRALGIDQRDPDVILAGGVSGGVWKSIDGGNSWELKTDPNQNMSVTSLSQDPNNPDVWYYSSGEFSGNSASDRGNTASYSGTGIYKSTDNGDSWSVIPATSDQTGGFDSPFDYISKIEVGPSGSIFAAANAIGLYKSTDGGDSFQLVQGEINKHTWTDFDIDQQGNIIAVLSSEGFESGGEPGVFYSTDDGDNWENITPTEFPTRHDRSVVSFAPSNPDTAYVFTNKLGSISNQGVSFFKLDIEAGTSEDRSANIPDFGGSVGGMNLQGGYNMVVSVKPDDPDFVFVGGTNLFRSTDGFATQPEGGYDNNDSQQKNEYWVGGYGKANNVSQYEGQHPDQHVVAWNPNNPDIAWTGHDGGLSVTTDVSGIPLDWQDKDNGYVTGQFYTVAIPSAENDNRILGGTQDNGTPFFRFDDSNNQQMTSLLDVSSGDGSYAHWGSEYVYVSSQIGNITRIRINEDGNVTSPFNGGAEWTTVYPSLASNQLFIHPYAVDPNDEGVMYYPAGSELWKNTEVDELPNYNNGGTSEGWDSFSATEGQTITALDITTSNPNSRLYYGSYGGENAAPSIFLLDDATTNETPEDISIPDAPMGAYIHDFAVNPTDGNEVIAVMSNYNITGLYHTNDGGSSWTAIEGNLEGSSSNPGPSIRNATILPTVAGPVYFVGTSTGVYSATSLSGMNTNWVRESDGGTAGSIGYSVSEYIVSRVADGKVAVGTHGRGIFLADVTVEQTADGQVPSQPTNVQASVSDSDIILEWDQNTESDISEYYVYRGQSSNSLEQYATVDAASQSYTDIDTGDGAFYYAVSAYDIEDNESPISEKSVIYRSNVSITNSWQLIGSPLTELIDASGSSATIFGFDGVYESSSTVEPQHGYWVKSTSSTSIGISGVADTSATITLDRGWNLIGAVSETINVEDIQDPNGVLGSSDIFRYSNESYEAVTQINPARGYWIYADQAGDITLSAHGSSSQNRQLAGGSSVNRITFSRGNSRQHFFVSPSTVENSISEQYRMPPPSPNPGLDIRTEEGFRLADTPDTKIQLTARNYPVNVELAPHALSSYVLKGVTGQDTVMYKLAPGREMDIQRSHEQWFVNPLTNNSLVQQHDLLPNYPNPFNPSTKIRYQLASKTDVTLEVYNILGRKVRTLVKGTRQAGRYNVTFDGRNLSSGIYFVHLKTQNITRVQKMTLLK